VCAVQSASVTGSDVGDTAADCSCVRHVQYLKVLCT
jgi:hypothetical protein